MRLCLLLVLLVLHLTLSHVEAEWYVAQSGSNANTGTSTADAWATLEYACLRLDGAAYSSDTTSLNLGAGTFSLTFPCSLSRSIVGALQSGVPVTTIQISVNGTLAFENLSNPARQVSNLNIFTNSPKYPAIVANSASTTVSHVHFTLSNSSAISASLTAIQVSDCKFTGTGGRFTEAVSFVQATVTITNTLFKDLQGSDLSGVAATKGSSLTLDSVDFDNMVGTLGVGAYVVNSNLEVVNCHFSNMVSLGQSNSGAGIFFRDNLKVNVMTVSGSTFTNCSAYLGGAISAVANQLELDNNEFINNYAVVEGAGVYIQNSTATVSNCLFKGNLAGVEYGGLSVYLGNTILEDCTFSNNFAGKQGAGAGFVSPFYSDVTRTIAVTDCDFYGNTLLPEHNKLAGTGLEIRGDFDTVISGCHIDDDNANSAVPAINLVAGRTRLSESPSTGSMPYIAGIIASSNNITLDNDLLINGSAKFIIVKKNLTGDRTMLDWIDLQGHTLTMISFDSIPHLLQSVVFVNGKVVVPSGVATFCCNADGTTLVGHLGIDFVDTSFHVSGEAVAEFKSTLHNVRFLGSSRSFINASDTSTLSTLNADPFFIEVDNIFIHKDAHMEASNMHVTGNVRVMDPGAGLVLFPTWWNGANAPLTINGDLQVSGNFQLADSLQLPPFPLVSFLDEPALVLSVTGSMPLNLNPQSAYSIKYEALISSNTIHARAIGLQPTIMLDTDLGSLTLELSADPNISIPLDCSGLVDLSANVLDIPSLRCIRKSATLIVISSSALPSNGIFNLNSSHPVIKQRSRTIRSPAAFASPVALIRPFSPQLSCGSLTLDGTLSYGFGSYSGQYYWALESTNDTTGEATLFSYLDNLPTSAAIVKIPLSYIRVGYYYRFQLQVRNGVALFSEKAYIDFVARSNLFVPPLSHDGPAERQVFANTEVVLKGIIDADHCDWSASKTRFQWRLIQPGGIASDLEFPSASTPSLHLPSSYFSSSSVSEIFTFELSAYPDPSLELSTTSVKISLQFRLTVNTRPLTAVSISRSSFIENEDVHLAVDAVSYRGEEVFGMWSILSCPEDFADDWFQPAGTDGDVNQGYECVNSTGDGFIFPFTTPYGLNTSVLRGTIEPGNYVVTVFLTTQSEATTLNIPFTVFPSDPDLPPQVSIALPPANKIYATEKIMLSAIIDGGIEGLEALELYSFDWRVRFGDLIIPTERNGLSVLVIPFNSMIPGQQLFVEVDVRRRSAPNGASGIAIVQVPVATVPTGGRLTVTPSTGYSGETRFTFTASRWTSPFWPLRYQFSVLNERGIENAVTEVMDIATASNVTLVVPGDVDGLVTVRVRVLDALGGVSTADYNVTVLGNNVQTNKRDVQMAFLSGSLRDLETAVNSSDWRHGYRVLSSEIFNRQLVGILEESEVQDLWNVITSLPLSTPLTESNVASIMTQLNHILGSLYFTSPSQLESLLFLLNELLIAETAHYGTNSVFSIQSTTYFLKAMSSILQNPLVSNLTSEITPISLLREHGTQMLDSFIPGEPQYVQESGGINVAAAVVLSSSTSRFSSSRVSASTPNSAASASFNPSTLPSSSIPNSYVGYTFTYYDGTFPYALPSEEFDQVSEIRLERVSIGTSLRRRFSPSTRDALSDLNRNAKTRKRSTQADVIEGDTRVTFIVPTTILESEKRGTCTRWDEASGSWTPDGCSSSSSGNQVQCDCTKGGPLTLLFSARPEDNGSSPGKGSTGMSPSAIAAAVIVPLIVVGVLIAGAFIYKKHMGRENLPSREKLEMNNVPSPSSASPPQTSTVELPRATWARSQLPTNV